MTTPLSQCIINTDVPWLIDPVTGQVVGVKANGSFQGAVLGAADASVAIYPGAQGPLTSFTVQSATAAAVTLNLGAVTFLDCTAGSIVATLPASVPAGQSGLVVVVRMDSTANNAASVTFVASAASGQRIADSNPKLANGMSIWFAFNGTYWKAI